MSYGRYFYFNSISFSVYFLHCILRHMYFICVNLQPRTYKRLTNVSRFKGIKKKHLDSLRQIFFATRRHSLSDRNYMKSYDCRRKKDFYEAFGTLRSFTVHSSTLFSVLTPEPDL